MILPTVVVHAPGTNRIAECREEERKQTTREGRNVVAAIFDRVLAEHRARHRG
jgi:hypothetical protein